MLHLESQTELILQKLKICQNILIQNNSCLISIKTLQFHSRPKCYWGENSLETSFLGTSKLKSPSMMIFQNGNFSFNILFGLKKRAIWPINMVLTRILAEFWFPGLQSVCSSPSPPSLSHIQSHKEGSAFSLPLLPSLSFSPLHKTTTITPSPRFLYRVCI